MSAPAEIIVADAALMLTGGSSIVGDGLACSIELDETFCVERWPTEDSEPRGSEVASSARWGGSVRGV